MSLCHSEHIFPESHIDMSQVWQPTASFYEESVFHDAELMLRSFNKTDQGSMSGLADVDLPFLVNGTMLWPENAWEAVITVGVKSLDPFNFSFVFRQQGLVSGFVNFITEVIAC